MDEEKKKKIIKFSIMAVILLMVGTYGFYFHYTEYKKGKEEEATRLKYIREAEIRKKEQEERRRIAKLKAAERAKKLAKQKPGDKKKQPAKKKPGDKKKQPAKKKPGDKKTVATATKNVKPGDKTTPQNTKKPVVSEEQRKVETKAEKLARIRAKNLKMMKAEMAEEKELTIKNNIKNFSGDITTKDGTVYYNVRILNRKKSGISINSDQGQHILKWKQLPSKLRKHFGYKRKKKKSRH